LDPEVLLFISGDNIQEVFKVDKNRNARRPCGKEE
jgi:hypothetical protein